MAEIDNVVNKYKIDLGKSVHDAEKQLGKAYFNSWESLTDDANELAYKLSQMDNPSIGQMYQLEQYKILQENARIEVQQIANGAHPTVLNAQAQSVILGTQSARDQMNALGVYGAVRLPKEELMHMVGRMQDGSPLKDVLNQLPGDAGMRIQKNLITAVGAGWDVDRTARSIRDALGGNMVRAQTIARTEIVGSHRQANMRTLQKHSLLLSGWTWVAATENTNPRPCMTCILNHGKLFSMTDEFGSHPRCRCTVSPVLKGERPFVETGEEWLESQPKSVVREILGEARTDAWFKGKIQLDDLIYKSYDPKWGVVHKVHPMYQVPGMPTYGKIPGAAAKKTAVTPQSSKAIGKVSGTARPGMDPTANQAAKKFIGGDAYSLDSMKLRQEAKAKVMEDLTDEIMRNRSMYPELKGLSRSEIKELAQNTVDQWSWTSANDSTNALAMQKAAAKEFGITDGYKPWIKGIAQEPQKYSDSVYQAIARAQYNNTQAQLASQGIKEVGLVRRMSFDTYSKLPQPGAPTLIHKKMTLKNQLLDAKFGVPTDVWNAKYKSEFVRLWDMQDDLYSIEKFNLQPISSFASDHVAAAPFGNVIMEATVPSSQIFGSARTGFGCLNETEFVVLQHDAHAKFFLPGSNAIHDIDVWEKAVNAFLKTVQVAVR